MSFRNFTIKIIDEFILHLELARPTQLNSMTDDFFKEISAFFEQVNQSDFRVIIITSQGKHFSAGLDLNEAATILTQKGQDPARQSIQTFKLIKTWQQTFTNIQNCRIPVIVGVQGAAIGGAIDMITSCDIRYATENAKFSIKEIDIGLAADLGTFPRLNLVVGDQGWIRELAYTGRQFDSLEANQKGLIQRVFKDEHEMQKQMLEIAKLISAKSPVAIYALKKALNKQNQHKIDDMLDYVATMNMALLNTKDVMEAVSAQIGKQKPQFPKL